MDYQLFLSEVQRTGAPIWTDLFRVVVPYKYLVSQEQLQTFGLPHTGSDDLDQEAHNAMTTAYWTIDQIVESFRSGTRVTLPSKHELKIIYDTVYSYLLAWKDVLQYGINVGEAPIEDLLLLDQFAGSLYNQTHLVTGHAPDEEPVKNSFLGRFRTKRPKDIFKNPGQSENKSDPVERRYPSLAEFFTLRLVGHSPYSVNGPAPNSPASGENRPSRVWR